MKSDIERLSAQWRKVFGTDIPERILQQGLAVVVQALEHGRQRYRPVTETSGNDDSLEFWDAHKQH